MSSPTSAAARSTLTPSLTAWVIATQRSQPHRRALLVAGPDLTHADAEVAALAGVHRGATVLTGHAATAEQCLAAIGDADLAHLACHGSYRADNPLFSTLRLADGPLTVYDLERAAAMPRTLVLSACNVALGASLEGGPLLGLASSLMIFGAGSVIAPLTPISDERVGPAMTKLHLRAAERAVTGRGARARRRHRRRTRRPGCRGVRGDRGVNGVSPAGRR